MAGLFFFVAAKTKVFTTNTRRTTLLTISKLLKSDPKWSPIWHLLDTEFDKWSGFVLGGKKGPGTGSTAAAIHGVERPSCRFVELALLAREHLRPLGKTIPLLQNAMNRLGMFEWAKLRKVQTDRLPALLKEERRERLTASYGEIGKKIKAPARTQSGTDRIFTVACPILCASLIKWRQVVSAMAFHRWYTNQLLFLMYFSLFA
jgi:hypothetical protein